MSSMNAPPPCPDPAAYVVPYHQGPTHSWCCRCDVCGHAVKHDHQAGAERIRDQHNQTGEWDT